jgi:hypothetical protein
MSVAVSRHSPTTGIRAMAGIFDQQRLMAGVSIAGTKISGIKR